MFGFTVRKYYFLVYETDSYSLTHLALQEGIGHCFLLRNDSQGISPKNVPHLGQT